MKAILRNMMRFPKMGLEWVLEWVYNDLRMTILDHPQTGPEMASDHPQTGPEMASVIRPCGIDPYLTFY